MSHFRSFSNKITILGRIPGARNHGYGAERQWHVGKSLGHSTGPWGKRGKTEEQRAEVFLAVIPAVQTGPGGPMGRRWPQCPATGCHLRWAGCRGPFLSVSAVSQHSVCSVILDSSCVLSESRYLPLKSQGWFKSFFLKWLWLFHLFKKNYWCCWSNAG